MVKAIVTGMLASLVTLGVATAYAGEKVHVATCRDGKEYYHETGERRGACSGHGGVERWADGTVPKSKKGRTEYR